MPWVPDRVDTSVVLGSYAEFVRPGEFVGRANGVARTFEYARAYVPLTFDRNLPWA